MSFDMSLNFNRKGAGRSVSPYSTPAAQNIRALVSRWQSKTLRVAEEKDLKKTQARLLSAGELLADYSAHGPRLLASIQTELARRKAAAIPPTK